jgi:hypothetical protein
MSRDRRQEGPTRGAQADKPETQLLRSCVRHHAIDNTAPKSAPKFVLKFVPKITTSVSGQNANVAAPRGSKALD